MLVSSLYSVRNRLGYTLAIGMHYKVYEHLDSPYQYVLGSMIVLVNVVLTTFLSFKIYRRFWPAGSE